MLLSILSKGYIALSIYMLYNQTRSFWSYVLVCLVLASDHGGRDFHQWELNLAAPDPRVEKSVDFSTKHLRFPSKRYWRGLWLALFLLLPSGRISKSSKNRIAGYLEVNAKIGLQVILKLMQYLWSLVQICPLELLYLSVFWDWKFFFLKNIQYNNITIQRYQYTWNTIKIVE